MPEYERVARPKDRIKEAMDALGKKQADLMRETGLNRGTISRYLKGEVEPRMDAAHKLAAVLNVNEMWLGGYDVPKARPTGAKKNDLLTELVVRLRHDADFYQTVESLAKLPADQYASVKSIISALGDK